MSSRWSGPARRRLVGIATVLALAVIGGAIALVRYDGVSGHPASDAHGVFADPSLADSPTSAPDTAPSPTTSPGPSPTHGTGRTPSRPPVTAPASPVRGSPTPTIFHLAEDICPQVDFTAVPAVGGGTPKAAFGDIIDKFRYVDHFCERNYPKVKVRIDGYLYPDPIAADAAYVDFKRFAPANSEHLDGIGTDAYGYPDSTPGDINGYFVWALEGNLYFKVLLYVDPGGPSPAALRAPTIATAKGTLLKLRP